MGRKCWPASAFGGLFDAGAILKESAPRPGRLDQTGVGTKVKLAAKSGRYATLGEDIHNHCVNDILAPGARRCSSSIISHPPN